MTQHVNKIADAADGVTAGAVISVPIGTLEPHPRNARRGDIELLMESLRAHGQLKPLVAQRRSRRVLCGNHVLAAAKQLGWTEILASFVDVDDDQALRILLIDNRTSDRSDYDAAMLIELLESLPTLDGTGFESDELERLLAEVGVTDDAADGRDRDNDDDDDDNRHDDVGQGRGRASEPRVRAGEVLLTGRHRLVCGDARDPHAWTRLLNGEHATLLIGDARPLERQSGADGAATDGHQERLRDVFAVADEHLEDGAAVYVFRGSGRAGADTLTAVRDRWNLVQELVWLHDPARSSRLPFPPAHGQIVLAQKQPLGPQPGPVGKENTTSVWATLGGKPEASPPAELRALAVVHSSGDGAVVVDPFAGDAATLLACEASGRTAHLLQPDPAVCEQILGAWHHAGGEPPKRGS